MGKSGEKRVEFCKKAIVFLSALCVLTLCAARPSAAEAQVYSSAIVIEQSSLRVLSGENIHARLPMASTTKIATAFAVIKNVPDLDQVVVIPKEAVGIEGSSIYLKEGEKLTFKQLLYGLMLRSGNDAAAALAIAASGSVQEFVALMNKEAAGLGLADTHFANPHGLNAENHYTSAYDLAVITSKAMESELFCQIISSKTAKIPYYDGGERFLANKNKMLWSYEGGNGVKTGYTKAAGRCLVASARRQGMQVISVVLNCGDMWAKCAYLMDYAFSNYKMRLLYRAEENALLAPVEGGSKKCVLLMPEMSPRYPLTNEEYNNLKTEAEVPENLCAPIKLGDTAGKIKVYSGDCLLFSGNLYTMQNVNKKGIFGSVTGNFDETAESA